uniref:Uncharacterized protein n=1 Tax=Manihot esculenta TaxID=3983 RepID=A0A2C9UAZ4_MANES
MPCLCFKGNNTFMVYARRLKGNNRIDDSAGHVREASSRGGICCNQILSLAIWLLISTKKHPFISLSLFLSINCFLLYQSGPTCRR